MREEKQEGESERVREREGGGEGECGERQEPNQKQDEKSVAGWSGRERATYCLRHDRTQEVF